ncbi:ectoine/hydroxyectoine ABC transporter permease subunit EhuC [Bosea vaviloviae]|uniref:Ectoine/hydroxyectoine ABC transporter permease subunit EhuC n=1 Tax=Bosea vaviloviae TaxID=1526658 RepID=A0A1D7UC70_9HYPH|nr:ectoine/hydroxyectoine ABC transporter permease subunit EhuC [Bosea vaviloviae]AOO84971.1 ectoine/hydroxyectoine ABC transporter permease subunit EhuC [Bosea vaviloviae]
MDLSVHLPILLGAASTSLLICSLSLLMAASLSFGAGVALFAGPAWLRAIAFAYVEIFRGTSLLVQLFWLYFALPLLGISLPPFLTGVLALGLNTGAYGAEVVRGALRSVSQQQHEAARALNFTRSQALWRIVLPQSVVEMLPSFSSLAVQNFKDTSLVSMITIADLTFKTQEIRNLTQDTVAVYGTALLIYFAMAMLIVALMRILETRVARSTGRLS